MLNIHTPTLLLDPVRCRSNIRKFAENFLTKFLKDETTTLAASLAFYTALSLAPIVIIFVIITATAYSLLLVKRNQLQKAKRFDMVMAQVVLALYLVLNAYFIVRAIGE